MFPKNLNVLSTKALVEPVSLVQKAWRGCFTPIEEKKVKEIQTPNRAKHRIRLYLWGGASSGALSKDSLVRKSKSFERTCTQRFSPLKVTLSETYIVQDVACGNGFTLVAAYSERGENNYKLFGCGNNCDSQIGLQHARKNAPMGILTELVPINFVADDKTKIVKVAAGRSHSIAISNRGSAYSLGNNSLGQCGRLIDPDEVYFGRDLLRKVEIPAKVTRAVCGLDHTIFLTSKGEVYSCGWGADGQTGLGHYENTGTPEKVKGDIEGENIVDISTSGDTVLAISDKGDLFGWGNNEYGQLLCVRGMQLHTPKRIPLDRKIKGVAAGGSSCFVLDERGHVFSWGFGILGVGPKVESSHNPILIPETLFGRNEMNPDSQVVSIKAGLNDFGAITSQHELYTWGRNANGSLGLKHLSRQMFPMKVIIASDVLGISIGPDHMGAVTRTLC